MRIFLRFVQLLFLVLILIPFLGSDCHAGSRKKSYRNVHKKNKRRRLARYRYDRLAVRAFSLVDLERQQIIDGYSRFNGDTTVNLDQIPAEHISILAHTRPRTVGSVLFKLGSIERLRNEAPYLLSDPREDGAFTWQPAPGSYNLSAVPFSLRDAAGIGGRQLQLRLSFVSEKSDPTPFPSPQPTASATATPVTSATPLPPLGPTALSAVWANDGGDKVTQDELRATRSGAAAVVNSVWNGGQIQLFAARNEVISFNLVLEAAQSRAAAVKVTVDDLTGPQGKSIAAYHPAGDQVFNYVGRNIELFYVRYLQIKGLSRLGYESYDERHIPERMRRPHSGPEGWGYWQDRADHDKYYPDIAVPIEAVGEFSVAAGRNQSIWIDIYLPKNLPAGLYTGNINIIENGKLTRAVPIELKLRNFTLPDRPAAKTMLYLGYQDINRRYLGFQYPENSSQNDLSTRIRDKHFQMAHRHKIALIDGNPGYGYWQQDQPRADWLPRLNGSLFTAAQGYDGPGAGVGNDVFSIGTYGSWDWGSQSEMRYRADNWVNWFGQYAPNAEYFLYLIDEVYDFNRINYWAETLNTHSGPGRNLMSFATISAPEAAENSPTLDISCSTGGLGAPSRWWNAAQYFGSRSDKRFCFYNGRRPMTGSFMIEDDGVALRQVAWAQYKMNIQRWFYWESTYYNNYQGGAGETDVLSQAQTFGASGGRDAVLGETGWNYSNGDGVLFYPGTDHLNPHNSYGLQGPLASLRLKHWRRGIQDVDYLTLAEKVDPGKTAQILNSLVPQALWEYGVNDPNDPTWVLTDISWPTDPDRWEEARRKLADLIESGSY